MSWRFVALCGVGLLLAPSAGRAATAIACDKPKVAGTEFVMTCAFAHRSTNLTLVMHGTVEDDTTAKPAEIAILAAGEIRQILTVESDGVLLDGLQKAAFEAIDLNFDGYDDLKVWVQGSGGPNSGYAYWLYEPAKGTFARRPDLDDALSGFEVWVEPKTKTVAVSGRDDYYSWGVQSYRWANDRLWQISERRSGTLDLDDALADVAGMQAFRKTAPAICVTQTTQLDTAGRITQEVIETAGDPCHDERDYRKITQGIDKTLTGTQQHGNVTDVYQAGILIKRTIVYDPPKQP